MFVDVRELPEGSAIEVGLCIVGAGAAGITLAQEFTGRPLDVCLLESGGLQFDAATQSLYEAETAGLPYFPLDANRLRSFGGATNLWAGWCRPLDALDFEPRSWVPHSGWPVTERELLPYYERAHDRCGLGAFDYDPGHREERLNAARLPLAAERVVTKIYRQSPVIRFGEVYRDALARAGNVRVLLHANAMEIETHDSAAAVTRLRVGGLSGKRFWVTAKHYVLACGGIENARLLLLSNNVRPAGLGNDHDLVGRHFMEHLHFPAGKLVLSDARAHSFALYARGSDEAVARLGLSPALQEQEELLNCSAMLQPLHWFDRLGLTQALLRLAVVGRRVVGRPHPLQDRLPRDFDPGVTLGTRTTARWWRLHHTLEQAPNPQSRVTLSTQRDVLGLNRVRLEWRTTPLDRRSAERAPQLIGEELARAGLGTLHMRRAGDGAWPPPPLQGLRGHHMGTTRMSADPRHGVVDPHCRVHGLANLFIAGSSVFPTSGAGTPTLTILALTLRLADHIKSLSA